VQNFIQHAHLLKLSLHLALHDFQPSPMFETGALAPFSNAKKSHWREQATIPVYSDNDSRCMNLQNICRQNTVRPTKGSKVDVHTWISHIILGSEMDFYKHLFFSFFFFFDNINNNQLHKHNTIQLDLFQKRSGGLLFMGEKMRISDLLVWSPELK